MASVDPRLWGLIKTYSAHLGLDPYAVAAVSIMEGGGRFGEVGDNGTSYGPFQLHVGGALPAGKNAAWANSPAGVYYAMSHMATVARGMTGARAIANIVSRFERPAAPAPEISGAISNYNALRGTHLASAPYTGGGGGSGPSGAPAGPQGVSGRGGNVMAALLGMSQVRPVVINPPAQQGKTVQQALGEILGQPQAQAFQPVQPNPVLPALSPGGQSVGDLSQSLESARQGLLKSFG